MRARAASTVAGALLVLSCAGSAAARAPVLHQVRVAATGGDTTDSIDVGPDGTVWFSLGDGVVRKVGAGGRPRVVATIDGQEHPLSLVAGPDGNAWLTMRGAVVRVTPGGQVTRFTAGLSPAAIPWKIAPGPDGNLWFTEYSTNYRDDSEPTPGGIGRITPAGTITEFDEQMDDGRGYTDIAAGPDGAMWFTMDSIEEQGIGRIAMGGAVTRFSRGSDGLLGGITAGPHGRVWFIDGGVASIGRHGHVRHYRVTVPPFTLAGAIARGPDG